MNRLPLLWYDFVDDTISKRRCWWWWWWWYWRLWMSHRSQLIVGRQIASIYMRTAPKRNTNRLEIKHLYAEFLADDAQNCWKQKPICVCKTMKFIREKKKIHFMFWKSDEARQLVQFKLYYVIVLFLYSQISVWMLTLSTNICVSSSLK